MHEQFDALSDETKDLHRAIVSLMEELEAVDWYNQRVDAAADDDLRAILAHNRDEEIEHAMMGLEWIRRNNAKFDENCRTYLFSKGPVTEVEEVANEGDESGSEGENAEASASAKRANFRPGVASPAARRPKTPTDGSLGIGSLKSY